MTLNFRVFSRINSSDHRMSSKRMAIQLAVDCIPALAQRLDGDNGRSTRDSGIKMPAVP